MTTRRRFRIAATLSLLCVAAIIPRAPCQEAHQSGVRRPWTILIDSRPPADPGLSRSGVWIHIVVMNTSNRTLSIEKANPEDDFLASIIDSAGRKVGLTEGGKHRYAAATPNSVLIGGGAATMTVRLAPGKDVQYDWRLDWLFDLSRPGKYRVFVSRVLEGHTIRSNTIELSVGE